MFYAEIGGVLHENPEKCCFSAIIPGFSVVSWGLLQVILVLPVALSCLFYGCYG